MTQLLMPQFLLSFGSDGMGRRLLKWDFATRKISVSWRQILQFISEQTNECLSIGVDPAVDAQPLQGTLSMNNPGGSLFHFA